MNKSNIPREYRCKITLVHIHILQDKFVNRMSMHFIKILLQMYLHLHQGTVIIHSNNHMYQYIPIILYVYHVRICYKYLLLIQKMLFFTLM